jgi:hypothetical protein
LLHGAHRWRGFRDDQPRLGGNDLRCHAGKALRLALREAPFDRDGAAFRVAVLAQALKKRFAWLRTIGAAIGRYECDARNGLGERKSWPEGNCCAQRDKDAATRRVQHAALLQEPEPVY